MSDPMLVKLFEHNNWANSQIVEACLALSDEQLDAAPQSATRGSIRSTLLHLATSQQGYLRLLTLPRAERLEPVPEPPLGELRSFVARSGEALLRLAADEPSLAQQGWITTMNGSTVEPWVLMLQVLDHAAEHREQIKSMLSALGLTPPEIDGLVYAVSLRAFVPVAEADQG